MSAGITSTRKVRSFSLRYLAFLAPCVQDLQQGLTLCLDQLLPDRTRQDLVGRTSRDQPSHHADLVLRSVIVDVGKELQQVRRAVTRLLATSTCRFCEGRAPRR